MFYSYVTISDAQARESDDLHRTTEWNKRQQNELNIHFSEEIFRRLKILLRNTSMKLFILYFFIYINFMYKKES